MTHYRIIRREDFYIIKVKTFGMFWQTVDNLVECPREYDTIEEARKAIEHWNIKDKVVEEINC